VVVVIVTGSLVVAADQREPFINEVLESVRESRAGDGCHEYAMCPDPIDPGRGVVVECWDSTEGLDQHLERARARGQAEGTVTPSSVELQRYIFSEVRPLMG
jgi:quinol monooxygenase YgiN